MTAGDQDVRQADRLTWLRLVAFSLPGVCIGAVAVAVPVFLPRYYAGHFKLGLGAVGAVFMAVRLFDMLIDPVIGVLMDRTRTALGRYRPWMIAGAPMLMAPIYMLFAPPLPVSVTYLVGWLLAYYVGWSLIVLSHTSWASVIAGHYHERSRVFGTIQIVGVLGAVAVLVLPVASAALGGSPNNDLLLMGGFIFIAAPAGILLAVTLTPERIVARHRTETFRLRDYWELASRRDMRRIIVADFCLTMGPGWMSALYLFYFHDSRGFTIADASKLLLIYIAAQVIGAAALSALAQRLGKHRTQMLAAVGYSLGLLAVTFLPPGDFPLAALFMSIMGFVAAGFVPLDRAMVADIGDAVRLETGHNRVGLLYSMITTVQKLALALSIGLSFTVLGWIGYRAEDGAHNTAAAIHGMEWVYLLGPVVFVMLGAACYIGYALDARRHAEICAGLAARDAAAA